MGKVNVRFEEASLEHAAALAPLMRPGDAAEVWAGERLTPLAALEQSLGLSDVAWTMFFDDEPAAMFGVAPIHDTVLGSTGAGAIWLLSGRAVDQHPMTFVRWSRPVLRVLFRQSDVLLNLVDARYEAAVRWLRWLGAELSKPRPYGPDGVPFHLATFRSSTWAG